MEVNRIDIGRGFSNVPTGQFFLTSVLQMVARSSMLFSIGTSHEIAMPKTTQMQIRLEPELKTQAEAVLAQLGLKPTEFVRMALHQLVIRNGLPFDARIPNAETIAALEEPTNGLQRFGSSEELFADLEARSHTG